MGRLQTKQTTCDEDMTRRRERERKIDFRGGRRRAEASAFIHARAAAQQQLVVNGGKKQLVAMEALRRLGV